MFAEAFIACGGIETLLVLLQRETKAGDESIPELSSENNGSLSPPGLQLVSSSGFSEVSQDNEVGALEVNEEISNEKHHNHSPTGSGGTLVSSGLKIERMISVSENPFLKNLGGITLSISADNARNNVYNVDKSDGIVVAIIGLLGALVSLGLLSFGSPAPSDMTTNVMGGGLHEGGSTMFDDRVSLLLFALQKAIQAAPNRLLTNNVYTALLAASVLHRKPLLYYSY